MVMPIAQLGQPVLRQRAEEVPPEEISTEEFQEFLDEMTHTLEAHRGAGLAAPQVFAPRRVFLAAINLDRQDRARGRVEYFINPRLSQQSPELESDWEGCLSFLELLVKVPRHYRLRVDYLDRTGTPRALELAGFSARVIQHEYDHLDGILTIDRAATPRDIVKASEIDAVEAEEMEAEPSPDDPV